MRLDIVRLRDTGQETLGALFVDGLPWLVTLEPLWRGNISDQPPATASCIPAGEYELRWHHSAQFGRTVEIAGVKKRGGIILHPGNTWHDTRGCVLVGQRFGGSKILQSIAAHRELMARLDGEPLEGLTIRGPAWVRDSACASLLTSAARIESPPQVARRSDGG